MDELLENGFAEVLVKTGMNAGKEYSADCSGNRSDCCTRVCSGGCSADANFVDNSSAWDAFLSIEGGQVQY
ncbi:hypothetical protein [Methylosoma difficile]